MSRIITVYLSDLEERAPHRPAGYVDEIVSHAVARTEAGDLLLRKQDWQALVAKYRRPRVPEQYKALAEQRAAICESCPQSRGVTLTRRGFPVYNVKCRQCGCGGLKLTDPNATCPLQKWPA